MRKPLSLVCLATPLLLAACGGGSSPCDGVTGDCVAIAASATESEVSSAFVQAAPNSTIAFSATTAKSPGGLRSEAA